MIWELEIAINLKLVNNLKHNLQVKKVQKNEKKNGQMIFKEFYCKFIDFSFI